MARKKPHAHAWARSGEGFLAAEGIINSIPGVFLGPDTGHARGAPALKAPAVGIGPPVDLGQRLGGQRACEQTIHRVHRYRTAALGQPIQQTRLREVGLFVVTGARHVGIAGRHKAELVGVLHTLRFQRQTIEQSLTDITALLFAVQAGAHAELIDLEVSPFIIGRQERMGIGSALNLGNLHNRLIAHALIGVSIVHWVARPVHQLEHLPVGAIRVVGNRQTFDALISQRIHPVPETLRVLGIQPGKRHGRQFVGAAKYDVTVQVADIVS